MLTRAAARAGRGQIQQSLMSSAASDLSERQQLTVKHDFDSCELLIEMPGSDAKAYLQYDHGPDGVVDLQHTVVPESFRGKGVAKILAKVF
ncbi:Protein NATD1 [Amphibalanus amphitrite]|uniref:Protein NATD1 n=1 Tax=Amphibalanus amphitrite TaxID=1232801 RepID=A0A6A4UZT7_AMPAM|nr:Protein NATD1 [Amphibalanus amphitrite]